MLEAHALRSIGPTLGEVLVDNLDPWCWPPQGHGTRDELILAGRTFAVVQQLARGRLPDVDIGELRTMRIGDLGARVRRSHGCSPWRQQPRHPASAESGRRGIGPVAAEYVRRVGSTMVEAPGDSPRGTVRAGTVS